MSQRHTDPDRRERERSKALLIASRSQTTRPWRCSGRRNGFRGAATIGERRVPAASPGTKPSVASVTRERTPVRPLALLPSRPDSRIRLYRTGLRDNSLTHFAPGRTASCGPGAPEAICRWDKDRRINGAGHAPVVNTAGCGPESRRAPITKMSRYRASSARSGMANASANHTAPMTRLRM